MEPTTEPAPAATTDDPPDVQIETATTVGTTNAPSRYTGQVIAVSRPFSMRVGPVKRAVYGVDDIGCPADGVDYLKATTRYFSPDVTVTKALVVVWVP